MPPRNYTRGDRAALILFGEGKCYWGPGCTEPLLKRVDKRYRLNLQIAHIRSDKQSAERYVPELPTDEVDAFENLLFLCKPHHDTVDEHGAGERFTIQVLEEWKSAREGGRYEQLQGLRNVTEDDLVDTIVSAVEGQNQDIRETLARLEETDVEAAGLIRELRDEIKALRQSGSILDPDVVAQLSTAAGLLANLEDNSSLLNYAADRLPNLEDNASLLSSAANRLAGLEGLVGRLDDAVRRAGNYM